MCLLIFIFRAIQESRNKIYEQISFKLRNYIFVVLFLRLVLVVVISKFIQLLRNTTCVYEIASCGIEFLEFSLFLFTCCVYCCQSNLHDFLFISLNQESQEGVKKINQFILISKNNNVSSREN